MTIPAVRRLIEEVLADCAIDVRARSLLQKALAESWRAPAARVAPAARMRISDETKTRIRELSRTTDMTMTDIADKVGLRNVGRVSEVLSGKR